jgi:anti-sigma factor RsiW
MSAMKCSAIEKKLSVYLDNRLPAAERAQIDAHLGSCEGCRGTLGLLRGAGALLSRLGPAQPRPGLADRLARVAIAAEKRPAVAQGFLARLLPMAWPWATATAAAAALLLVLSSGQIPGADHDAVPQAGVVTTPADLGLDAPGVAASVLGQEDL